MSDLISVVVPVYNVEKYLSKCIESIINQSYKNLEIILVDDGATDSCGSICEEYSQKDCRIKVIHKENGGLSDARNAGIDASTGDYIAFVDSDDYISEDMIEILYNKIINDGTDLAMCSFKYVDENGLEIPERIGESPIKSEVISCDEALNRLVGGKKWYYSVAWNKLCKKEIFRDIRYPKGKIHEDEFVVHRIFGACKRISLSEKLMYNYVQRGNSIISSSSRLKKLDVVEAMYDRVLFAEERHKNTLAYSALAAMANRLMHFTPFDEISKKRKEELYNLYIDANKRVSLSGLSIKRKVIVCLNKVNPRFLMLLKKFIKNV